MRIVYYSPHPTHDIVSDVGYSTHQREMIQALRDLGHEVIPVILGGASIRELPAITLNQKPNKIIASIKSLIPGLIWRTLKDARLMIHDKFVAGPRLRKELEKQEIDLVYERSEYCLKQGPLIAKEFGVKHIFEANAPCVEEWIQFEGKSLLTFEAEKIEKEKLRITSGVCPVSSPLARYIQSHYDIAGSRIQWIPNAINPTAIVRTKDNEFFRAELGLNMDSIVVGFVGAILGYHGVDVLVDAFIKGIKQNNNLRLVIVGDGDLLPDLKRKTAKNGMDDYVLFTGRISHKKVWAYMSLFDICVNPKHSWYGSPIKTFEYGAMGCPIIAPNEANMRDVLEHERTGLLYDGTVSGLEKAILALSSNPEQRETIGRNFELKVKDQHTWRSNAENMLQFAGQL